MVFLAVFPLLMPVPGQDQDVPKAHPFEISRMVVLVLDGPGWRPWDEQGTQPLKGRSKVPSATVEVVESSERDRQLRLQEFKTRTVPVLQAAFEVGHAFRTNVQMLAEFMSQDPAQPHPPSVPAVFYNNFRPPPENPALQLQMATGWSRFRVAVRREGSTR
ncbi:MAG: hypothetical protein IPQ13_01315 [Holophagaceae bacterium]|nr:hypothetical protein [Holophagaceae bacterium]